MTDATNDDANADANAVHAKAVKAAKRAVYQAKGRNAAARTNLGGSTAHFRQAPIGPHGMTPKQMKFFEGLISGKNQSEAYREAYNAENMSAKSVGIAASHLKMHPGVQSALMEWRHQAGERMKFTVENLSHMAVESFEVALDGGNAGQMAGAIALLAKLNGLIVERSERKIEQVGSRDRTALMDELRRLTAALGVRIVDVTPTIEAAAALPMPPASSDLPKKKDIDADEPEC
jgi:phage terminase small subunit